MFIKVLCCPCPQRALGEFPEKELQLQQMEVQGQGVLERTSEEGQVHILRDIKRLRESWLALYNMSLNLHRYLNRWIMSVVFFLVWFPQYVLMVNKNITKLLTSHSDFLSPPTAQWKQLSSSHHCSSPPSVSASDGCNL